MSAPDHPASNLFHGDGRICLEVFTAGAGRALEASLALAKRTRWESLRSPHLFMGLLKEPDAAMQEWAKRADLDLDQLLGQFERMFHEPEGNPKPLLALHREFFSDNLLRLLREAAERAAGQGRPTITSIDLLLTMLTAPRSIVVNCLEQLNLSAERLAEMAVLVERGNDKG